MCTELNFAFSLANLFCVNLLLLQPEKSLASFPIVQGMRSENKRMWWQCPHGPLAALDPRLCLRIFCSKRWWTSSLRVFCPRTLSTIHFMCLSMGESRGILPLSSLSRKQPYHHFLTCPPSAYRVLALFLYV